MSFSWYHIYLKADPETSRYEYMQLLPTLDNLLYNVQRQGKISFYVSRRVLSMISVLTYLIDDIGEQPVDSIRFKY